MRPGVGSAHSLENLQMPICCVKKPKNMYSFLQTGNPINNRRNRHQKPPGLDKKLYISNSYQERFIPLKTQKNLHPPIQNSMIN